ncbi:hypothetical protein [Streptomyces gardneri]|uniref:hypothetical protein n=1 Tax=Streptomyces gardneri TaxID=66892 RepID=UPI0035D7F56B
MTDTAPQRRALADRLETASARTAYADTERQAKVTPTLLEEWMPAFLAQLTAPGAQLTRATSSDGTPLLYLFNMDRESFAQFIQNSDSWTVRQGGPVALWDDIKQTLTAWQDAGSPDTTTVRLHVTDRAHTYWIGGQKITSGGRARWIADNPALRSEHRVV